MYSGGGKSMSAVGCVPIPTVAEITTGRVGEWKSVTPGCVNIGFFLCVGWYRGDFEMVMGQRDFFLH